MQVASKHIAVREAIINTLKYFHIFQFPLYSDEVHQFLSITIDKEELEQILMHLVSERVIYKYDNLYMVDDNKTLAAKRMVGSVKASIVMEKAKKAASIIANFPFVKAVCISGSLSKGYADEKSDIDFFIITQKHRLWICRTLLHLYKKTTFLYNEQHSYCMNYFIDESHLHLEEQNVFTATELATLIPLYNNGRIYEQLINDNTCWLSHQYPNIDWHFEPKEVSAPGTLFKRASQFVLNIFVPKYVNLALMYLTDKMWRFKWQKRNYPMHEYDLAMKTKWYVSKNHPANYQKKILSKLVLKPA
jgi:Nucleotidyltransferase domain.